MTRLRVLRDPFSKRLIPFATSLDIMRLTYDRTVIVPEIPHPRTLPDKGPRYSYDVVPHHLNLTIITSTARLVVHGHWGAPFTRSFVMSWPEYERWVDYRWRTQAGYFPTLQRVGYTARDYRPDSPILYGY
jgi:hypothetical protein